MCAVIRLDTLGLNRQYFFFRRDKNLHSVSPPSVPAPPAAACPPLTEKYKKLTQIITEN